MSIEGVTSYADIYAENLTDEDINNFEDLGVEWRGRNILEIRDEICIKAILVFARVYQQTAITNPDDLPQLKAEFIEVLEGLFDTQEDDEDETSSLLYRFDPISGTYRELIGAEGGFCKSIGKGFEKAGKAIKKGAKKTKKAVTKGVRETGRWVRENPVETAVIVVAAVTLGVTVAAIAGAGSAAVNAGSDADRKKDPNKDNKPTSTPPPNTDTSTNMPPPISNDPITIPSQPFIPPNPYLSYSQEHYVPSQYDISKPPIFIPSASGPNNQALTYATPDSFKHPLFTGSGNLVTPSPETKPAGVKLMNSPQEPSLLQEAAANVLHSGTKTIGLAVDGVLALTQAGNPTAIRPKETIQTVWRNGIQTLHEKIDDLCSTNMAADFDPKNDPIIVQITESIVTNPFAALNFEQAGAKAVQAFSNVSRVELVAAEATAGAKAATASAGRAAVAEEVALASRQAVAEEITNLEHGKGFFGKKGFELEFPKYQGNVRHADEVINGRKYFGHALDQMQNRGIPPSVIENAIKTGIKTPDPIAGRMRYHDPINKITVILEEGTGEVITAIGG